MSSTLENQPVIPVDHNMDTGERQALYGASIGALIGLVLGLFTSATVVPAMLSLALFGIMISGGVSLVMTLWSQARQIRAARSRPATEE